MTRVSRSSRTALHDFSHETVAWSNTKHRPPPVLVLFLDTREKSLVSLEQINASENLIRIFHRREHRFPARLIDRRAHGSILCHGRVTFIYIETRFSFASKMTPRTFFRADYFLTTRPPIIIAKLCKFTTRCKIAKVLRHSDGDRLFGFQRL